VKSAPYTHQAHALACCDAARSGVVLERKHVQVRRRQLTYCATILEAVTLENAGDCWTVETLWPEKTRMTVLVRNVTDCEGAEGKCDCAEARAAARSASAGSGSRFCATREARGFSQAGVVAPPESLTHETSPVSRGI
jgi:hypothetical protein